jgi:hypothetical protein
MYSWCRKRSGIIKRYQYAVPVFLRHAIIMEYGCPGPAFDSLAAFWSLRDSHIHQPVSYFGNCPIQSFGSSIMYISTSSVPDLPQLVVNSTRVKSRMTLACGSAQ